MATNRGRSRGQGTRTHETQTRCRVNRNGSEEVVTQYNEAEVNTSKQSYSALKKAFNDITEKYRKAQDEIVRLQTEYIAVVNENGILKDKLEKGFQAFDDKFKENEKLKKELVEKENVDEKHQTGENKQTDPQGSVPQEISSAHTSQETSEDTSTSTTTEEEKTDEVLCSPVNYKDILHYCGLEIVFQEEKAFLILINRDNFKRWLENEMDGKVIVDFERITQSDDNTGTQVIPACEHEAIVIELKNKITDQANAIKKYRQVLSSQIDKKTGNVDVKENVESRTSKDQEASYKVQTRALVRHNQLFFSYYREVSNQMNILKKHLEFQQNYTKHLVNIINRNKDLPKQIQLLSEVTHERLKSQQEKREIKKPQTLSYPVHEHSVDMSDMIEKTDDNELYLESRKGLYSISVQETNLSRPVSTGDESSASVVTLEGSRSSSDDKAGVEASQGRVVDSRKMSSSKEEETRDPSSLRRMIANDKQAVVTGPDNDDIVVISEDDEALVGGAAGYVLGAKQCPVCFISFTPLSSQDEFEKHVVAHFQD